MKFELEPDNRRANDEALLNDLKSVATLLAKDYVTKDEYNKHGRWCAATFQKRFGTWSKAHQEAGLRTIRHYAATKEDCVKEVQRVALELGQNTLAQSEFSVRAQISVPTVIDRCGPWREVLELAGLEALHLYPKGIPTELLFENLERLWETLGRQPKHSDFVAPLSKYGYDVYPRRFGSFRNALEAFVAAANGTLIEKTTENRIALPGEIAGKHNVRRKTGRTVGWRLRFLVMRRDCFKCRICGISPATRLGTILVVDHIHPWIDGGETVLENLQTLCDVCNGGKSDLPLIDP